MIFAKSSRPIRRVILTAVALVVWFYTQSLIGARPSPAAGIGDGLQGLTAPLHAYFLVHANAAHTFLIFSSRLIDLLAGFLLLTSLFCERAVPLFWLCLFLWLR